MPSPINVRLPRQHIVFAILLLALFCLSLFLVTRPRQVPTAPLVEVHRKNLDLRADGWFAPGERKGFTGFLLDTYEEGMLKSRSAVSNGLLHGLSRGWYTNGQQQVEEHFVAGISDGLRIKWHPNG